MVKPSDKKKNEPFCARTCHSELFSGSHLSPPATLSPASLPSRLRHTLPSA